MSEEYICRCEEVTRQEIEAAIMDGTTSIQGVKTRTRAGMGLCQGRTCRRLVSQMLAKAVNPGEILPATARPPVRALKINELIEGDRG